MRYSVVKDQAFYTPIASSTVANFTVLPVHSRGGARFATPTPQ